MRFVLTQDMFTNNVYTVSYGTKTAKFTIIDEEYASGGLVATIKRMICTIRTYADDGSIASEVFGSLVIGFGDVNVAVTTDNMTLRGKLLYTDNMSQCTVELYE
jgi:hypothetical protein